MEASKEKVTAEKKETKERDALKEPERTLEDRAREIDSQGFNIIDDDGLIHHFGE